MRNALLLASLALLPSARAASFDDLSVEESKIVASMRAAAAAPRSPAPEPAWAEKTSAGLKFNAECVWEHIDSPGYKYSYPRCLSLEARSFWPEWYAKNKKEFFTNSVDAETFDGSPLHAETLDAAARSAYESDSQDDAALLELFKLLRLATVVSDRPELAKRRVNGAVKTRWYLVERYAVLCSGHRNLCGASQLEDFYAIARHDWSPMIRRSAASAIYFLESDTEKSRKFLEEMARQDGQSVVSVQSDGTASATAMPSDMNKAFAAFLLKTQPKREPMSWGCFNDSLNWLERAQPPRWAIFPDEPCRR